MFYLTRAAGRYRVQSSSLDALWIVAEELVRRLEDHFGTGEEGEPGSVSYTEPLPLADFYACIDDHFEVYTPIYFLNPMRSYIYII